MTDDGSRARRRKGVHKIDGRVRREIAALAREWTGTEAELDRRMHPYYMACARAILPLLPDEASRRAVEAGERRLVEELTDDELTDLSWHAEGAAFGFEYSPAHEENARWIEEVRRMPEAELAAMVHLEPPHDALPIWEGLEAVGVDAAELLTLAAYFADWAFEYPPVDVKEPLRGFDLFLSEALFREAFPERAR